ncbi:MULTISPECIES: Photosystem I reaction center subunit III [unclassified Synechococcus]|uniref:Photosystem I reaction center subunit III n=1 Tax=unclassified Synechococcus TaxID=2626047 RepID=UPI0021A43E07|nr:MULTISPECIES: Photosystem I reaction center subunit III [unclassified Synechococcus]MCT0214120.1 Photosystem I reaction center subunit III [Synechococcus sp. CS-1326]MCT0232450.1 Photosystem I reaction center subunit III [Synechococcus sp. CS-1327]
MRRLFAVLISALLIIGFAPAAHADIAGLTPCAESPRFQARSSAASTPQAKARFENYSQALCGTDGLPRLIVDGRWSHAGDFLIPGLLFLYIAGTIGWAGRSYLIAIRGSKDATMREIQIDMPLAFKSTLGAAVWPLAAFKEFVGGAMVEADSKVTVSPR